MIVIIDYKAGNLTSVKNAFAALGAEGVSHIRETQHIARGYERLCEKLRGLGAEISAGPE